MKTRTLILSLILLFPAFINGQNSKSKCLQGSWMGTVSTQDVSLRGIFKFEVKNDNINGF